MQKNQRLKHDVLGLLGVSLLLLCVLNACKEKAINGKNSLVEFIQEAPGEECTNGGIQIIEGLDANGNNVLDEDEIESVEFICNGTNGLNGEDGQDGVDGVNSIVEVVDEPAGENCADGGSKILTGYDTNKNNLLDLEEILTTEFICNGEDGQDGGYNKKVEIFFPTIKDGSKDTSFQVLRDSVILYDFNVSDYSGVDSIVFTAIIRLDYSNVTATFQLFDLTNNSPILISTVENSEKGTVRVVSKNLIHDMPKQRFNVGIRGKSSVIGRMAWIEIASLILYRSSKNE